MKFELPRTTASFAKKVQERIQGEDDKALDISFSITTDTGILPMLFPAQVQVQPSDEDGEPEVKLDTKRKDRLVEELFSKEGYVRRPAISPLTVHRKPEGLTVKIHDQELSGEPMTLTGCSMKNLTVTLKSPNQVVLAGLLQYPRYDNNDLLRLNAIMGKLADIEWSADQDDLFGSSDPESQDDQGDAENE